MYEVLHECFNAGSFDVFPQDGTYIVVVCVKRFLALRFPSLALLLSFLPSCPSVKECFSFGLIVYFLLKQTINGHF